MIDSIAKCRLARYVTKSQLPDLMDAATMRQVDAGTRLFEEGSPGDSMFAILSGGVTVQKKNKDGTYATLTSLGPGDTIGEMALIDQQPRSAAAVAFEDSSLLEISREQLAILVKSRPDIAARILWAMVETISMRLRQTEGNYQAMLARALSQVQEPERANL